MNKYLLVTWLRLDGSAEAQGARFEVVDRLANLGRFGPTATYRLTGGGETMAELARRVARLDLDPALRECRFAVLTELDDVGTALGVHGARQAVTTVLEDLRAAGSYQALFIESERTPGTEPIGDGTFGGAIQLGTFSMKDEEGDWAVADWYDSLRLPSIEEMPGTHRARRLFSVCGAPKFGILYEFTSLETRERYFERAHEKHALDNAHPTGKIVERTIHAPMSPSVGERIFPAA